MPSSDPGVEDCLGDKTSIASNLNYEDLSSADPDLNFAKNRDLPAHRRRIHCRPNGVQPLFSPVSSTDHAGLDTFNLSSASIKTLHHQSQSRQLSGRGLDAASALSCTLPGINPFDQQNTTKIQMDEPEKNHKCPYTKNYGCSATFTTSSHAARHGRKHTGRKPAQCPVCSSAFSRKDNMKQQVRYHCKTRKKDLCVESHDDSHKWFKCKLLNVPIEGPNGILLWNYVILKPVRLQRSNDKLKIVTGSE